jgi:hypothetical protein
MKADDFLGQYQMMEQYEVASAEEVKVENLADHLRIEITAAGTVWATPCCGRSSRCSTSHRSVSPPLVVQETFRILRTINRNRRRLHVAGRAERQHPPRTRRLRLSDRNGMHCHGGGPAAIIACDPAVRRAYLGY